MAKVIKVEILASVDMDNTFLWRIQLDSGVSFIMQSKNCPCEVNSRVVFEERT